MSNLDSTRDLEKAALRGEPSYVWRDGQERRLQMILAACEERIHGRVLENGCGIGMYVEHLLPFTGEIIGLEYDFERAHQADQGLASLTDTTHAYIVCAAGEGLPFPDNSFDAILSHEVLEHVQDDTQVVGEMVRILRPGGRMVIFAPNRGYPFETHGIYWRGSYRFGNIPLVNWLPRMLRDRLAPHVRVYTRQDIARLFAGLPVEILLDTVIFGAYDNIIARSPGLGMRLKYWLQKLENTPLRSLGLSHFWVLEKTPDQPERLAPPSGEENQGQ
jgi:SAM-dependent methyltransferase